MKRWSLYSGAKDGQPTFGVRLTEVPFWVILVEQASEAVVVLTRHRLCCNIPAWADRVPIGKPKYDEDGWMENSLGWYWWRMGQRLNSPFWNREEDVLDLPVTQEQARKVDPNFTDDMVSLWDDEDEDVPTAG